MTLYPYKEYFSKIKKGDKVHYLHSGYHFVWVVKCRMSDKEILVKDYTELAIFDETGWKGFVEHCYVQPKEDRFPYKLFNLKKHYD